MPVEHATGKVASGDAEIFYRLFGRPGATPVVIVHGLSYFSYDWIDVASRLAADRQVCAMDMRGFGDSGPSASRKYDVPTMAGDIVAVLDRLGWSRAVLLGHSMGGRNTTYCAATHADRVAALILADYSPENAPTGSKRVTASVGNQPDVFETVEAAIRYFGLDPASAQGMAKKARYEAYLRPVPGGYTPKRDLFFRDQFKRILDTGERPKLGVDMWKVLGDVRCPLLVVRGAHSDMFAAEAVPKVREANPRAGIVEIDAGHDVAGESPDAFIAAVRPFLSSLESRHDRA